MPQLTEYEIHPAADIFPMMDAEAFAGLKKDIDENGVREWIVLFQEKIIDGRNRYRAMRELGIDPGRFASDLEECDDPVSYVLSLNLHRRHLTETQRSVVAAKVAKLKRGDNQHTKEDTQICAPSVSVAAKMLNVSERSVTSAKHAIDKGAPEVVKAMEKGELPASVAAKFVDVVPDKTTQQRIAKQGTQAIKDEVKKASSKPAAKQPEFVVPDPEVDVLKDFIPYFNGLTVKQRRTIKIWINENC